MSWCSLFREVAFPSRSRLPRALEAPLDVFLVRKLGAPGTRIRDRRHRLGRR
jgi:hypothetical protein